MADRNVGGGVGLFLFGGGRWGLFTAHMVGITMALGYAFCALGARHPLGAGLFLICAFECRPPMAMMFPLFLLEWLRVNGGWASMRGLLCFGDERRRTAAVAARFGGPWWWGWWC